MLEGRPDLLDLWAEYDEGTSPEARFVHDIDRIDMAIQAIRYASKYNVDTSEFLASAKQGIHDERLWRCFEQLVHE